ncbi:four helix bundle protein [Gracilimonas sp.]|uniref:four helix bundle protein n=1 Tax=Gracilimonas sp. TaxID=1974203 RepID=UPI0028723D13|nr:four helix bundle protein [Gracilimonas sp.]
MTNPNKIFDLEMRTYLFAQDVRKFVRRVPKDVCNIEDVKQLVKSSGSVGANYIEANEALSRKDFYYRIKLCRKESKESAYWLKLLSLFDKNGLEVVRAKLVKESDELIKIFSSIVKSQKVT